MYVFIYLGRTSQDLARIGPRRGIVVIMIIIIISGRSSSSSSAAITTDLFIDSIINKYLRDKLLSIVLLLIYI